MIISILFRTSTIATNLVNVLSSFRPHLADVRVLRTVQQPFEILKERVLVLVEESAYAVNDIAGVMPLFFPVEQIGS